jgi:hypothetical protein
MRSVADLDQFPCGCYLTDNASQTKGVPDDYRIGAIGQVDRTVTFRG